MTTVREQPLAGSLGHTPLPRLLVRAAEAKLSGSLEIAHRDHAAIVVLEDGLVEKIRTSAPVTYLGAVLYELGFIDQATLDATLLEIARGKRLHGEVLLERGAIRREQLGTGVRELTLRKLVHVSAFPASAAFAFYPEQDLLPGYAAAKGAARALTDPMPAVWAAIREHPPLDDVTAVLTRAEVGHFRLPRGALLDRFRFRPDERALAEQMLGDGRALSTLIELQLLPKQTSELLFYCLFITSCLEVVDPPVSSRARSSAPSTIPSRTSVPAMPAVASVPPPSQRRPSVAAMGSAPPPTQPRPSVPAMGSVAPPSQQRPSVPAMGSIAPTSGLRPSVPAMGSVAPPSQPRPSVPASGSVAPPSQPRPSVPASGSVAPPSQSRPSVPAMGSVAPPSQPRPSVPAMGSVAPPSQPRPSVGPGAPTGAALSGGPHPTSPPHSSRAASVLERARGIGKEDFFRRLSVGRDASVQQVHDAYRTLERMWVCAPEASADPELHDAQAVVVAALAEAHETLTDPTRRADYLRKLLLSATHQPTITEDLAASGQSNESDGAAACFAAGDLDRAERLARRANRANPRDPQALMLLAWLEARHASNQGLEPTKVRIRMLTAVLRMEPDLIDAYFYRAMLHKRAENPRAAIADLRKVLSLSPDRRDAQDELRECESQVQAPPTSLLNRLLRG